MLMAAFFFSLAGALVKALDRLPFYEVVFFRALFSVVVVFFLLRWKEVPLLGNRKGLLLIRGMLGAGGLLVYFYTLQKMPLASAVIIHYLNPIITTILSSFLLKEHGRPIQYVSLFIAFGGVALVYGFDPRVQLFPTLVGISGTLMAGFAYNAVRQLRKTEHPLTVIFSFPIVTVFVVGPFVALDWVLPQGIEWAYLFGVGVTTLVAQYGMTQAYHLEKLASVTRFTYVGAVFSILLGYYVFDESLPALSFLGILIVIMALLLGSLKKMPWGKAKIKRSP